MTFVLDDAPVRTTTARWRWRAALAVLAASAAALTVIGIGGSASAYYASIAVSMSRNWSNLLFGAFDPAGTVTLDKIPGSFWIPALFVRVFGYAPWVVVLPNALAAVAATLLVAVTARRLSTPTAGLVAGAVCATTPILVAVARSNQPQTFFVLGLALTAWAAVKALQRRSLGWLVVAGLFIALSFQAYMLEAWAVWPALAAAWLCVRMPWWRRIWTLAVAGLLSLAASLVWIVAVSLVPAADRPYIGSTLSNSPWEMVFGYNGLGRFGTATEDTSAYLSFTPPFSGDPGVFRLFDTALAGQIAWLLPAAALAIAVLWTLRFSRPVTVFLGVWALTFAAMFSTVAGMHQFYVSSLAVPMALAIGIAFAEARRRRVVWAQVALVAVAAVTALGVSLAYGGWAVGVAAAQVVLAAIAIALVLRDRRAGAARVVTAVVAAAALVLSPAAWSAVTVTTPSSINPTAAGVSTGIGGRGSGAGAGFGGSNTAFGAGSDGGMGAGTAPGAAAGSGNARRSSGQPGGAGPGAGTGGGAGPGGGGQSVSTETLDWLQAHQGSAAYLIATYGAQSAAGIILATDGGSVLPIGGFDGRDPVPTLDEFERMVASGELRYVLTSASGGARGGDTGTTAADIRTWVAAHCTAIPDAAASGIVDCAPAG